MPQMGFDCKTVRNGLTSPRGPEHVCLPDVPFTHKGISPRFGRASGRGKPHNSYQFL